MRTRTLIPAIILACLAVTPAAAQTVGIYVPPLSAAQAQDIALINGVIAIRKIEFDEGLWKIYGRDASGRRVEMKVDPRTGQIAQLERFD